MLCFSGRTAVVYTGARNKLAMACSHMLLLLRWMLHCHYLQIIRFLHIILQSHQMLRFTHTHIPHNLSTCKGLHTLCQNFHLKILTCSCYELWSVINIMGFLDVISYGLAFIGIHIHHIFTIIAMTMSHMTQ